MLMLNDQTREELWRRLIEVIEDYITKVDSARVAPELEVEKIRGVLAGRDFAEPMGAVEALDFIAAAMWRHQAHSRSPRYFGLFNPTSTTMGIAADALVAAFNPQLAAWSLSPFAVEVERHLVRAFGEKFGYDPSSVDGAFTSGGSEANHTALLTALTSAAPEFGEHGLRVLKARPVLYVSSQGHHSFLKAARASGLGAAAVREIPVDHDLRMDVGALSDRVKRDRAEGLMPLMIVATVGTTGAGVIDPVDDLAEVASREEAWFHVDAAWGGAAAFVPELRAALGGIEKADSITFDAHKWFSAPMGAGLYLTRHSAILKRTFGVATSYMPRDAKGLEVVEPFTYSIQWSRRFIGLKIFMSLLVAVGKGTLKRFDNRSRWGTFCGRGFGIPAGAWSTARRFPSSVLSIARCRKARPLNTSRRSANPSSLQARPGFRSRASATTTGPRCGRASRVTARKPEMWTPWSNYSTARAFERGEETLEVALKRFENPDETGLFEEGRFDGAGI